MDFLHQVMKEYNVTDVRLHDKQVIYTSEGLKRVRFWKDKSLLEWHIAWREGCKLNPYVTTDRMIQTKNEEKAVNYEKGWLTLHDEVTTLSPMKDYEHLWGMLFGQMLRYGVETDVAVDTISLQTPKKIESYEGLVSRVHMLTSQQKQLLRSSYVEAKGRVIKAEAVRNFCQDISLPLIDPILSPKQGKNVFQLLFWKGSDEKPEKGYFSFHLFLLKWLQQHGEESVIKLLDEINKVVDLKEKQGYLLLAECIFPYEYINLTKELHSRTTEMDTARMITKFQELWDSRRKLVLLLSNWLDRKRKQVAT